MADPYAGADAGSGFIGLVRMMLAQFLLRDRWAFYAAEWRVASVRIRDLIDLPLPPSSTRCCAFRFGCIGVLSSPAGTRATTASRRGRNGERRPHRRAFVARVCAAEAGWPSVAERLGRLIRSHIVGYNKSNLYYTILFLLFTYQDFSRSN
jgi:hypothetical protein